MPVAAVVDAAGELDAAVVRRAGLEADGARPGVRAGAACSTLTVPCMALEPYSAVPGPRSTSIDSACSVLTSNSSLTLQKPTGRIGMPFSRNRKAPQEPAPVSTGERIAVRLSWPLPRWIITPGTRFSTSAWWVAPSRRIASRRPRPRLSGVASAGIGRRDAVTTISSSSPGARRSAAGRQRRQCAPSTTQHGAGRAG